MSARRSHPQFSAARCTYCGRCADGVPGEGHHHEPRVRERHELDADLQQNLELFMSTASAVGRCFKEPGPLEQLSSKANRMDDLGNERWIYLSKAFLNQEKVVDDLKIESIERLC